MIIHPEIFTTPDMPTIRFRQPRDQVDLETQIPRILHNQGWECGTYFHVQLMNHERTKLLEEATFVVTEALEGLHTTDSEYQPVTKTIYSRKAKQIGDWTVFEDTREPEIKWNPGKQKYQLKLGNEVLFESKDKAQVQDVMDAA